MMKLSTMKAIVATLDERGKSPWAESVLAGWEHDACSAIFANASSNAMFVFEAGGQKRFLRCTHPEQRSLEAIQAEIAFVNDLAENEIWVGKPVQSLEGRWVETVETSLGRFHTAVFTALQGRQYELEELTLEATGLWGRAMGKMHNAAQGTLQPDRPSWQTHLAQARTALPERERIAHQALNRLEDRLARLPVTEQNFGLIHYDFELDNLLWEDGRLGIIDFDDCSYDWFAADIAYALRDLFDDRASLADVTHPRLLAFVEGYRRERAISDGDIELIPTFLFMSNLLKFAELLGIVEEGQTPDEPEWTVRLRQKLARMVTMYRQEIECFPW